MFQLTDLLAGLVLSREADDHFRAPNMDYYAKGTGGASSAVADIIAGGQLLAQAIAATTVAHPGKTVKSIHTVFSRTGRVSQALDLHLDTVQSGRSMSTIVLTFVQEQRPIGTATVMMHVADADAIRHAPAPPDVPAPGDAGVRVESRPPYELGVVESAEMTDPRGEAAAEQPMWVRFAAAPSDDMTGQALLAFYTNFPVIGIAMRPHAGLSVDQSHLTVSTGVLAHSMSFHEPIDASRWMLTQVTAPYAGRGRVYGRGDIFDDGGRLLASFTQEGLIRALAQPSAAHGASATL